MQGSLMQPIASNEHKLSHLVRWFSRTDKKISQKGSKKLKFLSSEDPKFRGKKCEEPFLQQVSYTQFFFGFREVKKFQQTVKKSKIRLFQRR